MSNFTQKLVKRPKKNENSTLRAFFDALPHNQREEYKDLIKTRMGWTENQWRNRLYKKADLSLAEVFLLEAIIEEKVL